MKTQQWAITTLATSAVILAFVLIVMPVRSPVQAQDVNVGRNYSLVTTPVSTTTPGSDDYISVINNHTGDIVIYELNRNGLVPINAQHGQSIFSAPHP